MKRPISYAGHDPNEEELKPEAVVAVRVRAEHPNPFRNLSIRKTKRTKRGKEKRQEDKSCR